MLKILKNIDVSSKMLNFKKDEIAKKMNDNSKMKMKDFLNNASTIDLYYICIIDSYRVRGLKGSIENAKYHFENKKSIEEWKKLVLSK